MAAICATMLFEQLSLSASFWSSGGVSLILPTFCSLTT
jgi:hypothetical protein